MPQHSISFPNASDGQLVEGVSLGNRKAFVEIVHRYQNLVTGVTLAVLRDFSLSEDAAQEAFILAWQRMSSLKDGEKLRPWLCQIARNTAINHSKKRRPEDLLKSSMVDPSPRPDELAISRDEHAAVLSALNSLPEKYRLPLVLYYREDQSVRSVAKALSQSEATIRKQLSRGRNLLKGQMGDLLKSVLPRTNQGPLFTATVAGLIGAMLKPTAVAATAFSAKPVTASATAVTTSKFTFSTAAIIAAVCLPVGYTARTLIADEDAPEPGQITAIVTVLERESFDPELSPIAMEWQQLLASCQNDPKAFPNLYETILKIPGSLRREAFLSLLIVEWIRLDPANGWAFVQAQSHTQWQQGLYAEEWIKKDIDAAIDGLLRGGPGWDCVGKRQLADVKEGQGWKDLFGGQLKEIATRAPGRLKEILEALPGDRYYLQGAFSKYFTIDPDAAFELANSLTGEGKQSALSGIVSAWSEEDFEAALAWTETIEDRLTRSSLIRSAIISLSLRDPRQALVFLQTAPPEMKIPSTNAIRTLAEIDFQAALDWIAQYPGEDAAWGLDSEIYAQLLDDPETLIDTLHTAGILKITSTVLFDNDLLIRPTETRTLVWNKLVKLGDDPGAAHLRKEIVSKTSFDDPYTLMTLVDRLPDGPDRQNLSQEVSKKIFLQEGPQPASSRNPFRIPRHHEDFSEVIDAAPGNWQGPLVEAAFNAMRGGQFAQSEHLDRWVGYLDFLPNTGRPEATQKIAVGIAQRSPEKMTGFFSDLKSDDERLNAGVAFIEALRVIEPEIGIQWLESTPMNEELRKKISSRIDPFQ